jgi:hypothetical protein
MHSQLWESIEFFLFLAVFYDPSELVEDCVAQFNS